MSDASPPVDVLLVDDDPAEAHRVEDVLADEFRVAWVRALVDAERYLKDRPARCLLVSPAVAAAGGLLELERVVGSSPEMSVVVLTLTDDAVLGSPSRLAGASDVLAKSDRLVGSLRQALARAGTPTATPGPDERAQPLFRHAYESILQATGEGIWVLDAAGATVSVNATMAAMLGYGVDEARGLPVQALLHDDTAFVLTGSGVGGDHARHEARLRHRDGSDVWTLASATAVVDDAGTVVGYLMVVSDVTAQRRADASSERFRALVGTIADVVTVVDAPGVIRYASPATADALGHRAGHELVGRHLLDDVHPDDRDTVADALGAWVSGDASGQPVAYRVVTDDGGCRNVTSTGVNLLDDPAVHGIVLTTRDISGGAVVPEQLSQRSLHDPLTGLATRDLFLDRLGHALARAKRGGSVLAVLAIDVDQFELVNSTLGRRAGDQVLTSVASLLEGSVRSVDSVGRLDGDEFMVCLEEVDRPLAAVAVAQRLQERLRAPFGVQGGEVHVTATIGMAMSEAGRETPESLVDRAATALARAKQRGRSRIELFDETAAGGAVGRLELESALRQAVYHDQFVLHFQPEIDLADGRVVGVEALVRWDRGGTLLSPSEFVPLAEESGLIVPIGNWVLRTACREAAGWSERSPGNAPVSVSVNLAAAQLAQPDLVDLVSAALDESGLPAAALCLEITETVLMGEAHLAVATLDRLRQLGVRLAVDDFGTGYSSLQYLKRFPVDVLKVDQSFVGGLGRDSDDTSIVAAVVNLAHSLGLRAIAEGVERVDQRDELRALGCDSAQGYLWSPPLGATDLGVWLGKYRADPGEGGRCTVAPLERPARARQAGPALELARRQLADARSIEEVVATLIVLVRRLGGVVLPAHVPGPAAMPLDLSFGEGESLWPTTPADAGARAQLEEVLPPLVDDGRRAVERLRRLEARGASVDPATGLLDRRAITAAVEGVAPGNAVVVAAVPGSDDASVRALARLLREESRTADACGRSGEEEFVLVLSGTGHTGAVAVVDRLEAAWERAHPDAGRVRWGVAAAGADVVDAVAAARSAAFEGAMAGGA